MANTSYLRYTVEPWVRDRLAERYGQRFAPLVLPLGPGGTHEFDAVSDDRRIVVSIKANSGLTSGGNHPTGKVATCLNEVYFLTLVDADVRLLVLTNPGFHAIFTKTTAGQIAPGIGIELLPLPSDMQQTVDGITERASREMSRDTANAASAVEAEEAGERGEDVQTDEIRPCDGHCYACRRGRIRKPGEHHHKYHTPPWPMMSGRIPGVYPDGCSWD